MKKKKIYQGGSYTPLKDDDIKKIHNASLQVFEETGIEVRLAEARELFQNAGAVVAAGDPVVKIPAGLVEELLSQAPPYVTLCGRDESGFYDCEIGGQNVYMGTGGTALNVQDPGADDSRRATLDDIAAMARLVERLDNIHFYMLNVYPNELSAEDVDVNRFGIALKYTQKHIMGGVYTVEGIRNVIKMAEMIAGGPDALRERPIISMVTCVVSPLRLDEHYSGLTIEVARQGIPVVVPAEPLSGATAPVTLAGTLVVQNVDTLAGVMLAQLANRGSPVVYGSVASVADLATMKYLSGAVEMGLLNAAAAQMAQFYHLPYYATAGMTDAKIPDAQAGYESALTNLMVALAGGNFIHDAAGFIEFCMTASYDKLVIDNEIIGMVMRAVEGIEVNDDTIALEIIKKVGPGGHYVAQRHTRHHMRKEQYVPEFGDRSDRIEWNQHGSNDAKARAAAKVREILGEHRRSFIPDETMKELLATIPNLKDL
ncbi:MAG: trimethylamine methyltransferase family protein [Syntrophales bacterium]|jgi:trimethylamine--corrinoid protein Co-methyltransferase|nr:trimethylamine methyltransferase family protein [Syntrophales bacterium]